VLRRFLNDRTADQFGVALREFLVGSASGV
jgi:hypothetical protein